MDAAATTLDDIFRARAFELRRRIEACQSELIAYEKEMARLSKAAEAADVDLEDADLEITKEFETREYDEKKAEQASGKTMKEAAVEILEGAEGGLTANEILYIMHEKYRMNYPRSSLSPQLSRLKYDNIVGRQDGRWVLPKYMRDKSRIENEAPKAASETEKPALLRRPLF